MTQCMPGKETSSYETDKTADKISFLDIKLPKSCLNDNPLCIEEQHCDDD